MDIIEVLIAGGGLGVVTGAITSFSAIKWQRKKGNAEADRANIDNLNEIIKAQSERVDELFTSNKKLYTLVDELQTKILGVQQEWNKERIEFVTKLSECKYNECIVPNCAKRNPIRIER